MQIRDAIVIGGGHNGLTCAAYLARVGMDVLVVERRPVLERELEALMEWPWML
jgi:phytoene dehydrogenase-like protein